MKTNHFKFILLLITLIAAIALPAQAQKRYAVQTGQSFTCAAATATNIAYVIDCRDQASVAISIVSTNSKPDAALGNTLYYQRSIDGSNYETLLKPIGWTTSAADVDPSNPRVIITNLPTFGCQSIRFPYATNASGSTTNIGYATINHAVNWSAPSQP
jgi:hypothetical protein